MSDTTQPRKPRLHIVRRKDPEYAGAVSAARQEQPHVEREREEEEGERRPVIVRVPRLIKRKATPTEPVEVVVVEDPAKSRRNRRKDRKRDRKREDSDQKKEDDKKEENKNGNGKKRERKRRKEEVPETIERFKEEVVCATFAPSVKRAEGYALLSAWGVLPECVVARKDNFYLCTTDSAETARLEAALEAQLAAQDDAEIDTGEAGARTLEGVARGALPPDMAVWHCTACGALFEGRPAEHERVTHSARAAAIAAPPAVLLGPADVAERTRRYAELHAIVVRVEALHKEDPGAGARAEALRSIERAAHAALPRVEVRLFGSFATGLWDTGSDLDVALAVPGAPDDVRVLSAFLRSLRRGTRGIRPFLVRHARVPLAHIDFEASGLACDVTCNNLNGCHNSALVRDYTTYDARVLPYLVLVRDWGRRSGVVNSPQGFLSAYALVVLALVYVQVVVPEPLLPVATSPQLVERARARAAQGTADLAKQQQEEEQHPDLELRHLGEGFDYVHVHSWRTRNTAAPEELFHGFLAYYGYAHDFAANAVDAHDGRIGPKAAVAPAFAVQPMVARDPFLRDFNMCQNINPQNAAAILFQFRDSAHKIADME